LKALKDTLDTYDEPVKKNMQASNKRMVQAVNNFLPFINANEIANGLMIGVEYDFYSIFTIRILWWASVTLLFFGPWDALLSSALSGFKDGLSDYATAQFEAMIFGIYMSALQPFNAVTSTYLIPYNLTLYFLDWIFYAIVLILMQSIYFIEFTWYIMDLIYQFSVLLTVNFE
jgi:hypothetical protein